MFWGAAGKCTSRSGGEFCALRDEALNLTVSLGYMRVVVTGDYSGRYSTRRGELAAKGVGLESRVSVMRAVKRYVVRLTRHG